MVEGNSQPIPLNILTHNDIMLIIRIRRHTKATALPQRIPMQPTMAAHYLTLCINNVTRTLRKVLFEKVVNLNRTQKTNTLAILSRSIWQTILRRKRTHLGFYQPPHRKHRMA